MTKPVAANPNSTSTNPLAHQPDRRCSRKLLVLAEQPSFIE